MLGVGASPDVVAVPVDRPQRFLSSATIEATGGIKLKELALSARAVVGGRVRVHLVIPRKTSPIFWSEHHEHVRAAFGRPDVIIWRPFRIRGSRRKCGGKQESRSGEHAV